MALARLRLGPGLAGQVIIGFVLGTGVGVFLGEMARPLEMVGDAFILLLQIAVIPYIVTSLITALGRLTLDEAKRLGVKAVGVMVVLWTVGVVVLLLTPLAFPDWPSASFFSTSQVEDAKPVDFLSLFIPANPFASLANAAMPAIVVFTVLIGVALISVANKHALLEPLEVAAQALMRVTGFVARLAPYGVFALVASAAGTLRLEEFHRLQVYVVVYMTMTIIVTFWVLPGLITAVTPLRYMDVLRAFREALVTAFAAGSVLIVLPLLAAQCKRLMEGVRQSEGDGAGSTVDVLIPAAYNFPGLGNILALSFVLFAGWYIGSSVPVAAYPLFIGAGLTSLFGGTVLTIQLLLDLLELPRDLFQFFVTINTLGTRFGAVIAVMTISAMALMTAFALQGRLRVRVLPLLRFAAITALLLGGAMMAIRAFYTHVVVAPYTKDQALRGMHLLAEPQPAAILQSLPPELEGVAAGPATIEQIRVRGVLRACYLEDNFPASFLNADGDLVGFDIELVHRLARSLRLPLEFVPVHGEGMGDAVHLLEAGVCDLYASTIAISARRAEPFAMTVPVFSSSVGLIVADHEREAFRTWDAIRAAGGSIRIAIPGNPEASAFARAMLPQAELVPLDSLAEQRRLLESESFEVDAIADLSEEGAAWTLLYPRFTLVVPEPAVFTAQGFAVARGNESLVQTIDAWIVEEQANGTVDALYRYWMLGDSSSAQAPRWSVIRNVLHWVE